MERICEIAQYCIWSPGAIGGVTHLRVEGRELASLRFQIGQTEDDASVGQAHHYPGMREVIKPREGMFENFDRKCKTLIENARLRGKTNS